MTAIAVPQAHRREAVAATTWIRAQTFDRVRRIKRPEVPLLAAALLAFYEYMGWWMRYRLHFAIGDSLARSADAVYVAIGRDPHLGAIGFYWPPLSSFIQIPFVYFLRGYGHADMAGPISTGVCMAATVVVLGQLCRTVGLNRILTLIVLVIFGLNPIMVFYAANGMSEASAFLCLSIGMLGFIRYCRGRRPADMALMAGALAFAAMARVEAIACAVVVGLIAAVDIRSLSRSVFRAFLAVLPPVYLFALWMGVQWILLRDPLYFRHIASAGGGGATTAAAAAGATAKAAATLGSPPSAFLLPSSSDKVAVARWALLQVCIYGPALILVAGSLVLRPWRRAREAIGILAGAGTFLAVQVDLRLHNNGFNDPRYFSPLALFAAIGVIRLLGEVTVRRPGDDTAAPPATTGPPAPRPLLRAASTSAVAGWTIAGVRFGAKAALAAAAVGVLAMGAITATVAEANPHRAKVVREDAFFSRVIGRDNVNPFAGIWPGWQQVSRATDKLLERPGGRHLVICDASRALFAAVAYSRHPNRYIVINDRDFQKIVADPAGKFDTAITVGPLGSNDDSITPILDPTQWSLAYQNQGINVWTLNNSGTPPPATGVTPASR